MCSGGDRRRPAGPLRDPPGDVLGVARVAGIMAAKRTPDLIPLCHPIAVSRVSVDVVLGDERSVEVRATVECDGKTGVEMEALTAASTAALTVYDMCKAVDKGMVVDGQGGTWLALYRLATANEYRWMTEVEPGVCHLYARGSVSEHGQGCGDRCTST